MIEATTLVHATGLKIEISDPLVVDELADALAAVECTATRTARDTLVVHVPCANGEVEQARMELQFFVKAWEACRPGVRATVSP